MAGKYLAPRTDTPGCFPKGGNSIRDKRRKIITISLAVLFFLLALGLTIYPVFSSRYNEAHQSQIHTEYQDAVQALPDTAIPEARAAAQAYNEGLWSSIVQYGSYSKDSVTSAVEEYAQLLDLTGTGTMGYVHIPKLAVSLPIYHGPLAAAAPTPFSPATPVSPVRRCFPTWTSWKLGIPSIWKF